MLGYCTAGFYISPMDINERRTTGRALKELRERQKLTQVQVAARLNNYQSHVSKIESGERTLHAHEIFTYAKALGVTPYELLDAIENALK